MARVPWILPLLFVCGTCGGAACLGAPVPESPSSPIFLPAPSRSDLGPATLPPLHRRVDGVIVDAVIVFTDSAGVPILPDFARSAGRIGLATNQLHFTFDSPNAPWSAAELDSLRKWARDYYPVAVAVFGPPAFDITVNVRKLSSGDFDGFYLASINEIQTSFRPDVFVHEMLHAFHDDAIFGVPAYAEGLTRAAECAVLDSLGYTVFAPHHMYEFFDVHYDMLNKPALAAPEGNLYAAPPRMLLRYQLGGYAWEKPYLESRAFFIRFNQAYFAAFARHRAVAGSPDSILAAAAWAAPTVEGEPFAQWAAHQHVLNAHTPHTQTFLYQDFIDDSGQGLYTRVDLFKRVGGGELAAYYDELIAWRVVDASGRELGSGGEWTYDDGHIEFTCEPPSGYVGRAAVVTTARTADGTVADTTWRSVRRTAGLFGVVPDALDGIVTATRLGGGGSFSTQLSSGCFDLPELESIAGTFEVTVAYPDGRRATRTVTKDASRYYVLLGPAAGPPTNLVANPSFDDLEILGWASYGGSTFRRTYPGRDAGGCLYVVPPPALQEYGINDHPNWVARVPRVGTVYRFTAWVRGTASAGKARMRVREYAPDKSRIGDARYSNVVALHSYFQQLTLDFPAACTASSLDLQIVANPTAKGSWIMVDDVSIQMLTVPAAPSVAAIEPPATAAARFGCRIVPQPVVTDASLELTTTAPGPLRLTLHDLAGRRVRTLVDESFAPAGTRRIAIARGGAAPLAPGVYFWRLAAREGVRSGRLVVAG